MKLLDLYCCAGGCSYGYHQAGFNSIIGVDIRTQRHYPYKFIMADAIGFLEHEDLSSYDLVHASPPCQAYTMIGNNQFKGAKSHPDLVNITRELLEKQGVHYVIENVLNAPLRNPIMLDGSMFNLPIIRKRLFETNWSIVAPEPRRRRGSTKDGRIVTVVGHSGCDGVGDIFSQMLAMGIHWMDRKELTQAIPPAYTKYIGEQFKIYCELLKEESEFGL